jgi:hypothetical protein
VDQPSALAQKSHFGPEKSYGGERLKRSLEVGGSRQWFAIAKGSGLVWYGWLFMVSSMKRDKCWNIHLNIWGSSVYEKLPAFRLNNKDTLTKAISGGSISNVIPNGWGVGKGSKLGHKDDW